MYGTTPLYTRTAAGYAYYQLDHLGTPQQLVDKTGKIQWRGRAQAFGKTMLEIELVRNNFRFARQYYDEETGLYYNYFRYYDPAIGRYITSDPANLLGGINTYSYVLNNPLYGIDQYGLVTVFIDPNYPVTQETLESKRQIEKDFIEFENNLRIRTASCPEVFAKYKYILDTTVVTYIPRIRFEDGYRGQPVFGEVDYESGSMDLYYQNGVDGVGAWSKAYYGDRMYTIAHEFRHLMPYNNEKFNKYNDREKTFARQNAAHELDAEQWANNYDFAVNNDEPGWREELCDYCGK